MKITCSDIIVQTLLSRHHQTSSDIIIQTSSDIIIQTSLFRFQRFILNNNLSSRFSSNSEAFFINRFKCSITHLCVARTGNTQVCIEHLNLSVWVTHTRRLTHTSVLADLNIIMQIVSKNISSRFSRESEAYVSLESDTNMWTELSPIQTCGQNGVRYKHVDRIAHFVAKTNPIRRYFRDEKTFEANNIIIQRS